MSGVGWKSHLRNFVETLWRSCKRDGRVFAGLQMYFMAPKRKKIFKIIYFCFLFYFCITCLYWCIFVICCFFVALFLVLLCFWYCLFLVLLCFWYCFVFGNALFLVLVCFVVLLLFLVALCVLIKLFVILVLWILFQSFIFLHYSLRLLIATKS